MKRLISALLLLLCHIGLVYAQSDSKQLLDSLFVRGEQCYLMDDYKELLTTINRYEEQYRLTAFTDDDEAMFYVGYYDKMCGAYYYGLSEEGNVYSRYSEDFYRQSLNIFLEQNSTDKIITLHKELAQLYYKIRVYEEACAQLYTVMSYYQKQVYDLEIYSEESEIYNTLSQLAMCNARMNNFQEAISQIDKAIEYYSREKPSEYYEAYRRKGKILMLQANAQGSMDYSEAFKCYELYVNYQYSAIGQRMSSMDSSQRSQYWLAIHQFLYDCYRLGNYAPRMLYNLALFSKGYLVNYEKNKSTINTKWEQVRKELTPEDCAIEFVQYFGHDDEKRMGCLVLHHNTEPLFIDLFSADSVLNVPLTSLYTVGEALSSFNVALKDSLYQNDQLPRLVWTPRLMDAIGDASKVFFAPDGMLHQLAIEYIMPDTTKVCYRMSSTRNIKKKRSAPKLDKALLCGGMRYDTITSPERKDNDIIAYRFLASNIGTVKYLPGAREEVSSIYACRHNAKDLILTDGLATDENFLRLYKDYDLIHLATHGYYGGKIGVGGDLKPLLTDQSMSKSGVLFAGASTTLADVFFDENMYDGILSATELSQQDFSDTELVVLSACETGLGHITDDGIYGVERGLKQAGANALILSLWSVDDKASNKLMSYFYDNLEKQQDKDIHSAFLEARKKLMNEEQIVYEFDPFSMIIKASSYKFDAPRYINPFIIIDAY